MDQQDQVQEQQQQSNAVSSMQSSQQSQMFAKGQFPWANQTDIKDNYIIHEEIGSGSFGKVHRIENLRSKYQKRAVKIIPKKKIANIYDYQQLLKKLIKIDHSNILKLYEVYEEEQEIYIIMELCEGGELLKYLIRNKNTIQESQTSKIIRQISQGLQYLHERDLYHGDVNIDNLILKYDEDDSSVKLINYGLFHTFSNEKAILKKLDRLKGNPFYQAPEINSADDTPSQKSDIWSLGVVLYVMISGYSPFKGSTSQNILENMHQGIYSFNQPQLKKCSLEVKDLISQMLIANPNKRINSKQVHSHVWSQQQFSETEQEQQLHEQVFQGLQLLVDSKNDQKRAMLMFMVSQMPEKKKKALRKIFDKIDEDGSGAVTEEELVEGMQKYGPNAGIQMTEDQIRKVFKQMDYDGGGSIDFDEFLASFCDNQSAKSEDFLREQFKKMDKDGSGSIGREELMELLKILPLGDVDLEEMVNECDKDGDGEIDFEEFMALLREKTN